MKDSVALLKEQADIASIEYRYNKISREQAKKCIMPYINVANEKSKELAKKYNMKPKLIDFNSFVR